MPFMMSFPLLPPMLAARHEGLNSYGLAHADADSCDPDGGSDDPGC